MDPLGPSAAKHEWLAVRVHGAACGTELRRLQGYTLTVRAGDGGHAGRVEIDAPTPAGARHGLATLAQLLATYDAAVTHDKVTSDAGSPSTPIAPRSITLPALRIEDWPTFATRGVMLDVSRDRVPTMRELFEIVDFLAALKYNHLQLYTEHTFAYAGHEEVWAGWSPITPDEVIRLDAYARERGVELAANQNCFGHLASWLRRPKYAHLAETHGDWIFDCWPRSGPFSLCPTDPASIRFVEDLLGQLLPCFTSPLVNIGCDETYDISYGRSKGEVERRGRVAVYLDFVREICAVARRHGKRPMFWADIALSRPEAVREIPEDLIALAWGYEADSPFERWCAAFREAGRDVWVCPGTSSWRSITGRTTERRANIESAARAGEATGASGFLLCDWGDTGHHQQWAIAKHALAHGAQAAWNGGAGFDPRASSIHAFGDSSGRVGHWLDQLGDADLEMRETGLELSTGKPGRLRNQSAIFIDMLKRLDEQRHVGAIDGWRRVVDRLAESRRTLPSGLDVVTRDELEHTLNVSEFAARRALERRNEGGLSVARRQEFKATVEAITREHRRLWLMRSRRGGLDHSCTYYEGVAKSLEG